MASTYRITAPNMAYPKGRLLRITPDAVELLTFDGEWSTLGGHPTLTGRKVTKKAAAEFATEAGHPGAIP